MSREVMDFEYATGETEIVLNSDISWETVEVPAGLTLTLRGPMRLRTENIRVGPDARVVIDTSSGPVGIYNTGSTIFDPGSILENIGDDPTQCSLFALTPDVDKRSVVSMGAKGEFKGMIVAPRTTVQIPGNLQLTGSVVAENLQIGDHASVRFDENLIDGGYGIKMTPTLISWEVIEVPDRPITRGNAPVETKMNLLGYTSVPASTAHREQDVQVHYRDNTNTVKLYDGPATGVPWTDVQVMDHMNWYYGGVPAPPVRPSMVVDSVDDSNGNVDTVAQPAG